MGGCSRTTAYRATTDLEERGLLEQVGGRYSLTGLGTTVLDRIEQLQRELDGARHLGPVLTHIDAPALREHAELFADATVVERDPDAPYAIEHHLEFIIADTDERIYGAASSFGSPALLDRTVERIQAGVAFEWALPNAALDRIEHQHGELHATVRASDATAVYVVEDVPIDFSC